MIANTSARIPAAMQIYRHEPTGKRPETTMCGDSHVIIDFLNVVSSYILALGFVRTTRIRHVVLGSCGSGCVLTGVRLALSTGFDGGVHVVT